MRQAFCRIYRHQTSLCRICRHQTGHLQNLQTLGKPFAESTDIRQAESTDIIQAFCRHICRIYGNQTSHLWAHLENSMYGRNSQGSIDIRSKTVGLRSLNWHSFHFVLVIITKTTLFNGPVIAPVPAIFPIHSLTFTNKYLSRCHVFVNLIISSVFTGVPQFTPCQHVHCRKVRRRRRKGHARRFRRQRHLIKGG